MSITIEHETTVFFVSFLSGILCSVIFDFLRAVKINFKHGIVFDIIADISFWTVSCLICYTAIFIYNDGKLRLYEFIGIGLGCFLYFLTISTIVKLIFVKILDFIKFIFKILLTPLGFLYKILYRCFIKIKEFSKTFRRKYESGTNK